MEIQGDCINMELNVFVIGQAVKKEFVGIKSAEVIGRSVGVFFIKKEDAQAYLGEVIKIVKLEIKMGKRKENSLNKDEWLDFCITEATLDIPDERMKKRGWK